VVEVVTEKVTNAYLSYLHKLGISYIFAGKEEIDYVVLMEKLYDLFHIETLLLEGNGLLNGLILNANLLDEVSIVLIPASDSSTASYSLFDVPPHLGGGRTTTVFSLKSVQQIGENGLWMRYLVKR
jgi:riboflavin biosynthesis pyrimidine reductase